ncbi:hypothetical protein [Segetibacter koreensis]|uniref:hypothetical protein n=1 Tax=Segetibacter koreensis TaxID=398037 RepID=UPI0003680A6D|nr:hypothetical protein [Segetibacter koreensis]
MKKSWKRISDWERWPFYLIYAPLGFVWLYYAWKAKAVWFFSNVNPTIEFSGFEGEPKKEMYEQLPVHLYPETLHIKAGTDFKDVMKVLMNSNIKYPFIVKPEIGMQGILFRKIELEKELSDYHYLIPVDYIIQEYVDLPLEFSVFHIRYPSQTKGKVTGFILKEYMYAEGDGMSTLLQLIKQHPKAKYYKDEMHHKHKQHLHKILQKGEKYVLSIAGNHNRGARFINLHKEIDQQLCNVFDNISLQAKEFYFGRYDLKCTSIEDLKKGKNIFILEFNGAGAEPNHIYDCGMSYIKALKEVANHWKDWYEIGKINKQRGIHHWSFIKGYRYLRNAARFFKNLRQYDIQY